MTTLMTNQRLSLVPNVAIFSLPYSGWGHEGKELITIEGESGRRKWFESQK
jgi:hypothetical protein